MNDLCLSCFLLIQVYIQAISLVQVPRNSEIKISMPEVCVHILYYTVLLLGPTPGGGKKRGSTEEKEKSGCITVLINALANPTGSCRARIVL